MKLAFKNKKQLDNIQNNEVYLSYNRYSKLVEEFIKLVEINDTFLIKIKDIDNFPILIYINDRFLILLNIL